MSLWIRVYTNFFTHRKTMRLKAAIGDAAFWVPPRLWAYAAENQPDGDFSDYTDAEIASLISYSGCPSVMLQALLRSGFMDGNKKLHDWAEYNGFHKVFAERARKAANARHAKNKQNREEKRGDEASSAPSIASSMLQAQHRNGAPKKFIKEIAAQIQCATDEIQRLKDFGTESDRPRIRELVAKRSQWKKELLEI